jgi:hypothetical protein
MVALHSSVGPIEPDVVSGHAPHLGGMEKRGSLVRVLEVVSCQGCRKADEVPAAQDLASNGAQCLVSS